jgi:alkylation response protein AidB-like acyl-CoA dehydrogenase
MPGTAYREFNFGLGEEIDAVRDQVRRFADERIAPRAAEIDRSNEFPRDLWGAMGELGLLGMTVPPEHGGAGLGYARAYRRDGGDLARLGRRRLELRRAFQSLREPDRA